MKVGLLSDIHEDVEHLAAALERFRCADVEQVVVLGDVFETGRRLGETVELLARAGAIGVWGNHDFGLCHDPSPPIRKRFDGPVIEFMTTLRPRLEVGDGLFSHVEPWLDPFKIEDLWYFEGPAHTVEQLAHCLDAAPHRLLFTGHIHRWMVSTRAGRVSWDCFTPFRFEPHERYLVVVGAICDGRCGIWDAGADLLIPIDLRDG